MNRLARLLPPGSSRRVSVLIGVALIVSLAFTQFGLPKRTPGGVLMFGLIAGAINALIAGGLIVVYRSARVVNFAQVAMGGLGAALTFRLGLLLHWPFVLAFSTGLLASVAVGVLVELTLVRRFFNAPRLVLTVVTIVLAVTLSSAADLADKLPGLPDPRDPGIQQLVARGKIPMPFDGRALSIEPLRFGFAAFFALLMIALAFVGLGLFLRHSRMGRSVRAAAENADRVMLLGINVRMLSTAVWAVAGALGGLAAILQGMNASFTDVGTWAPETLIPGLAAAVIARMKSLPIAVVSAVTIAVLQQSVFWSFPQTTLLDLVLLLVIAVGLLSQRRRSSRNEEGMNSSWEAVKEIRPIPTELLGVPGLRRARRAILLGILIAAIAFPIASSPSQTNLGSLILIQALIALSLVVLVGWAGQVSLGQFAFVAVGAVVGGKLTSDVGLWFWLALPLVAVFTGAFASLVGLPALRIRGIFLAVTTLAFAVAVQRVLFNQSYFGWLLPDRVERPSLLFIHFADERNYFYLCLVFMLLAAVVVKRMRASRPGRVLIALREDENGVQTFGISAARMRLAAFALSGGLAGIAGMLYAHHQRAVDATSFGSQVSVEMFIMAMIGGITSVSGALLGAAYIGIVNYIIAEPLVKTLTRDVGLLVLLVVAPGGLSGIVYGLRDSILRIVAQRNQILVPSLFADYDPEAIRHRKQPLAERAPGNGLDALPVGTRYSVDSDLYPAGAHR